MTQRAARSATNLTRLQRRRLSWRIAKGMTLPDAAAKAGLDTDEADGLLDDGHFPLLVEAYRALAALPEHARRRRLLQLAIAVIEQAAFTGDMRVSLFVMKQETLGRDAAEATADGVIRALERREPQRRPPNDPAASTQPEPQPRAPSCPSDNAICRAAASLRSEVMDEFEMQAAVAMAAPTETPPTGDAGRQAAAPVEPVEQAETEQPEQPGGTHRQNHSYAIPAGRLTERQLQYLADLAIARSQPTGPPHEAGPDHPEPPDTG